MMKNIKSYEFKYWYYRRYAVRNVYWKLEHNVCQPNATCWCSTAIAETFAMQQYHNYEEYLHRYHLNKLTKPRYLHGSHWGRYCPAETPEGMNVGLETQLTASYVSLYTDPRVISEVISQYIYKTVSNVSKVFLYTLTVYMKETQRLQTIF